MVPRVLNAGTTDASDDVAAEYSLLDRLPVDAFVMDREGRIVALNQRAAAISGVPAQQHRGRYLGYMVPELWRAAAPLMDRVFAGERAEVDVVLGTRAATEHWWPIYSDAGTSVQFAACLLVDAPRPVDAKRLAAAVLEAVPEGVLLIDHDGRISLVNPALERMLGYEADELMDRPVEWLVPDHLRTIHRLERGEYAEEPAARSMGAGRELSARHKQGHEVPVEIALSPLIEAAPHAHTVAIVRDVTEQRQLLRALQDSEETAQAYAAEMQRAFERLRALIDASPVGVVIADRDGRLTLMNDEARRLTGATGAATTLRTLEQIITYRRSDGESYRADDLPLQRTLANGDAVRGEEVVFEWADGTRYVTRVSTAPVHERGEQVGAIATIHDVSDLAEARRVRETYVEMVRHELANPLTVLLGYAYRGLRRGQQLDGLMGHEILREVVEQGELMSRLLAQLRELDGLSAGRFSLEREPIAIRPWLLEVGQNFREVSERELEISVADRLGPIEADPERLRQVLMNLLLNAEKFSEPGTVIVLRAERDGEYVRFSVADQGIGIAPHEAERLFQPFTRLARTAGVGGTGLGLAVSRAIVEAHGGRIWVESAGPTQGSTFTFVLPL